MIRLQASRNEVELSGRRDDLKVLSEGIHSFIAKPGNSLVVEAEFDYDPQPYDTALKRLHLQKNASPLHAEIQGEALHISARPDMLELFAKNLPFWAEHPESGIAYHVHFESSTWPGDITEESVALVLLLRSDG